MSRLYGNSVPYLEKVFAPSLKDCYQEVLVLPPVDEIEITPERVSLILCEPSQGGGLHPDLLRVYDDLTYPNRILFLSEAHGSLGPLLETAAELKAIDFILEEMSAERVPENDPQHAAATTMRDNILFRLFSATREMDCGNTRNILSNASSTPIGNSAEHGCFWPIWWGSARRCNW